MYSLNSLSHCGIWRWDFIKLFEGSQPEKMQWMVTALWTPGSHWCNFYRRLSLTTISLDLRFLISMLTFTDWAVCSWHMSQESGPWGAVCCLWLQSHIVFKFDWQPPSSEKYFSTPNQLHFSRSYWWEFANIQFSLALTALTQREKVLYILEQLLTE